MGLRGDANDRETLAVTAVYISMVVLGLFAALAVVVAMRPADFSIVRTAVMPVSRAAAFERVNDFHQWEAWSPWAKLDPNMRQTFEGAPRGEGAVYSWNGDKRVGEGRMTITESRPNELVRIRLEFIRPFVATNPTEFAFRQVGDATEVTWTMRGKNNFMGKAMHLLMNMEKLVGTQFEQGLAQMSVAAQAASR